MSGRKSLPHDPPLGIDMAREIFFITLCALPRGVNQLACPPVVTELLDTVGHRHSRGEWFAHLFLFMPDHAHALLSFPSDAAPMKETVRRWKRWTARQLGIEWQRDFFEHRLRHDESAAGKAEYILQNPVRAGLVAKAGDWPHLWRPREPHFPAIQR
jgi:hypothetical protein